MGKWGGVVLVVYFLGFAAQSHAAAAPTGSKFGRFSGVFRHTSFKRDQLAKLDFIPSREDGNTLHLKAILTLHFGDFKTGEYVGIHFDDVRFDLTTQTFVFEQPDQPVTLIATKFTDTEFVGEFRSNYSGGVGEVILSRGKDVEPKHPLIESVWGEYRGVCKSKFDKKPVETLLQLYTHRSTGVSNRDGNPFRAYTMTGLIGEKSAKSCGHEPTNECVWGQITQGSYNVFKNKMVLFTTHGNLTCEQTADGLSCADCSTLKRVSKEISNPRILAPVESKADFGTLPAASGTAVTGNVSSIEGEYSGYLHHEYLNTYQHGSLNVLTYRAPANAGDPSTLRMSAIATLQFGDENSSESLSYHFAERSYPNPLAAPQFVFSQADADIDAILQVTEIGNGVVSGIWYSRLFGRVGSFRFSKNADVAIPVAAKKMQALSGDFANSVWELYITVGLGSSEPGNQNPFAPLEFGGWVVPVARFSAKADTVGGSYDFYTGRISFEFENSKTFIGHWTDKSKPLLKKVTSVITTPMPSFDLEAYRAVE